MFAAANHQKIETMWMPSSASTTASEQQQAPEQPQKPHSKSALRRAKHLLAALSFEPTSDAASCGSSSRGRILRHRQKKQSRKNKKKSTATTDGTIATASASFGNVTRGLRVETSDSSGCDHDDFCGEADDQHAHLHSHKRHGHGHHSAKNKKHYDVYFDAAQYGDLATNEFAPRPVQRDSVVLAGITIQQSNRDNDGGAYETVYRDDVMQPQQRDEKEETTEYDDESEYSGTDSATASNSHQDYDDDDEHSEAVEVSAGQEHRACVSQQHRQHHHPPHAAARPQRPPPPPLPPRELPLRFLRAGKNNPVQGLKRYEATLQMRAEEGLDTILREPSPLFSLIKQHYPHFCHLKGKNGEPCFYEQPPKTNLKALRAGGVNLQSLLRHYKMITEYQWQWCERDDLQHSIYVIDLEGIRMMDFVGESVEFVKLASAFSAQHYPERAGFVFVVNVPSWFKMIWTVVKPIVDEDTLHKIYILRGRDEIRKAMMERIPLENIPPEYGGNSMPLGESPEEQTLAAWVVHNNALAATKGGTCCDDEACKFCNWTPARAY